MPPSSRPAARRPPPPVPSRLGARRDRRGRAGRPPEPARRAAALPSGFSHLRPSIALEAGWLCAALLVPVAFWHSAQSSFELPKQLTLRTVLWAALLAALTLAIRQALGGSGPLRGLHPAGGRDWLGKGRALALPGPRVGMGTLVWLAITATALTWLAATLSSTAPEISWWGHPSRVAGLWTQLGYLALFVTVAATLRTRAQVQRLCAVSAVAASIAAAYALVQRFGLDPLQWGNVSATAQGIENLAVRPSGTFGNPNFLSGYLVQALFLTLGAGLASPGTPSRRRNGAWLVAAGLQTLALATAQTRGAWVGAGVGGIVFVVALVAQRGGARRRWLVGLVAAGVVVAIALRLAAPLLPRGGPVGRLASIVQPGDNTASQRLILWAIAAQLWAERPLLGYGLDTFEAFSERRLTPELVALGGGHTTWARAENGLLDTLFSVGALGTLPLLALTAGIAALGIGLVVPASVGRATSPVPSAGGAEPPADAARAVAPVIRGVRVRGTPLAVGLLGAFAAHLATQQFGILEVGAATEACLLAGALAGCGPAARDRHSAAGDDTGGDDVGGERGGAPAGRRAAGRRPEAHVMADRNPGWLAWGGAGAALVALGFAVWWESAPMRANLAYSAALAAGREGERALEQTLLEKAVAAWPHNYRYWVSLSEARRDAARALPDSAAPGKARLLAGAVEAADRARVINPADPVLLSIWADTAGEAAALGAGAGSLGEAALRAHAEATRLAPNSWEVWQSAGITDYRLKRYPEARAAFERATQIFPKSATTWALLGDAAGLTGDRAAARTAYRRSIELDPGNEAVQKSLASLGQG